MELTYSHVDILVSDLEASVNYYKRVLGWESSDKLVWNRDGFHVEFVNVFKGKEKFILVQPIAGVLKDLMDEKGEGTIYRLCYTAKDVLACYDELIAAGVHPENENGRKISKQEVNSPSGRPIIWLPKEIGGLSIEILQEVAA